jgi:hypothetical protein
MQYVYPHAEHWIHFLEPAEITYLMLFAYCNVNRREKIALIPVSSTGKPYTLDHDEEHGNSAIDIHLTSDETQYRSNVDDLYEVTIEYSFSAQYSDYDPGDWNNPPEGGDAYLTDVTVDSVILYAVDDDHDIDNELIKTQTTAFTYKDLNYVAEDVAKSDIEGAEDQTDTNRYKFPPELDEKIRGILKDNHIVIRNSRLSKEFGI